MATTRRTNTKVSVPVPPSTPNGTPSRTSNRKAKPPTTSTTTAQQKMESPIRGSPYLPTPLEALLLAIYPTTLLLGSLFSSLHPASRHAPYNSASQSYLADQAPSYFAKKSNVFNLYFVKIGWFWTTLAFFLLLLMHPARSRERWGKGRTQALVRYVGITTVWVAVTQWFFGPPIIDRGFRWTGGQCEIVEGGSAYDAVKRAEMGEVREVFTHAACKTLGGQWKGGHDISGHVFLLVLGSAMLWLEVLPVVLRMEGLREARRVRMGDGLVRSAAVEKSEDWDAGVPRELGIGGKAALAVAGLSWWMLLMTAAYFHTWFEKFTGLMVAFGALYVVYFLPRAVPALRRVVGMPGV